MTVQSNLRAMAFERGLQMEGIHSLLLVQGKTKEILQRWMENLGVMVWAIDHWELLHPSLENIKNSLCAAEKSESMSRCFSLSRTTSLNYNKEHDGYSSSRYVPDQILPITTKQLKKKPSFIDPSGYILVVIDLSCGNISEICSILKNFTSSNHNILWKIVWLVSPNTPAADLSSFNQEKCDLILQKPLHGSRLYALLKLLQEFGGTKEGDPQEMQIMNTTQEPQHSSELGSSTESNKVLFKSFASQSDQHTYQSSRLRCNMDDGTALSGMNILLVEDTPILSKVAKHTLSRLGATVEHAENGLEAVNLVKKALRGTSDEHNGTAQPQGDLKPFPYNVILMDCEVTKELAIIICIYTGYNPCRQKGGYGLEYYLDLKFYKEHRVKQRI